MRVWEFLSRRAIGNRERRAVVRLEMLLIAGQRHVSGSILSCWHGLIHDVMFEVLLICVGLVDRTPI